MNTTIYKRLFEVHILHDYFLSTPAGAPFSSLKPEVQKAFLKDELIHQRYDIHRFLKIEPSPAMKKTLKDYHMRMVPTPLGFFLGMEVKQIQSDTDRSTFYESFISLGNKLSMGFLLRPNDELFFNYTNLPLQDLLPARWYFTNRFEASTKSPDLKVLSALIPEKDGAANYEMGSLVKDGVQIQEAFTSWETGPAFLNLAGDGFVTGRDRILLPKRFAYDLGRAVNEEVVFNLNKGNSLIKSIQKKEGIAARVVDLNFEKQNNEAKTPIPDGEYTLKISAGPSDRKVILDNNLYEKSALGAIEIFPFAGNPSFDLLDQNGRLITRIDQMGSKQPHPVFELRFASRKPFWRYFSAEKFDPNIIETYKDFLQHTDETKKVLVSKEPHAFSKVVHHFKKDLIPPQPTPYALRWEAGRYFTDIHLSSIAHFKKD